MSWLGDDAGRMLTGALDGLAERQALIASNLANIDTPGYRPESIDFESALSQELAAEGDPSDQAGPMVGPSAEVGLRVTDPRHFRFPTATGATSPTATQFDGSLRNDGNTVDVESEMTALAESQLKYAAVSRLLSGKLGMLRDVAGGH